MSLTLSASAILPYSTPDFDIGLSLPIFTPDVGAAGPPVGTWNNSKDENQIREISEVLISASATWESVREKLAWLRDLPADWDTFGGDPIPNRTIENALELIDKISGFGGEAEWVEPTSEGAIALQSHFADSTVRFEIDDSNVVGLAVKKPLGESVYLDVSLGDVAVRVVDPDRF
jgi:hypothetical protein